MVADIKGIRGIQGTNFLEEADGVLHVAKQELHTDKGKVRLVKLTGEDEKCARVRLKGGVDIPPHSDILAEVRIEGLCRGDTGCVVPGKFTEDHQVLVARSLVDTSKSQTWVSLLNVGDKSVRIGNSTMIGKIEMRERIETQIEDTENKSLSLPDHLRPLLDEASQELTPEQKQQLNIKMHTIQYTHTRNFSGKH